MIQIPFDPTVSSAQEFRVDLGGLVVTMNIAWNIRYSAWFLDVYTDDAGQYGIRISPMSRLLLSDDILGITGNLFAIKEGQDSSITYDNLGSDFNLYWFDEDDLNSLEG